MSTFLRRTRACGVCLLLGFVTAPALAAPQSVDADPDLSWSDFPGQFSAPGPGPNERSAARPHAPWIFRCTLDERPRMLVLALAPECWVSYDAQACRFDAAWRGGVRFDGSVYTGAHGPNPRTEGEVFLRGPEAPFVLVSESGEQTLAPRWKGYRIDEGRAVLMYEATVDGRTLRIEERPEAILRNGGLALERRIELLDAPAQGSLALRFPRELRTGDEAKITIEGGGERRTESILLSPGAPALIVTELPTVNGRGGAR